MEEKEIIDELTRISKTYPQRNVYMDCMMLQLLHRNHFATKEDLRCFDRIAEKYRMIDIIEFSKIGRTFKQLAAKDRVEMMIRINDQLKTGNFHDFIIQNFA